MKRDWTQDELIEHWTLAPGELLLLMNKSGSGRLGFAALLKFFQAEARFPAARSDVPEAVIEYLAAQTKAAASGWAEYDWQGRTIKYHRAEIRVLWGFREATTKDGEDLTNWLCQHVLTHERNPGANPGARPRQAARAEDRAAYRRAPGQADSLRSPSL